MAYGGGVGLVQDRTGRRVAPAAAVVRPRAGREIGSPHERVTPSAFPELDCVRDRLPSNLVAAIEQRATELGVSADRVIVACGAADEEAYLIALARWLGWDYETFERADQHRCPISGDRLIGAARYGFLPLQIDGALKFVVAPRSVREMLNFVAVYPRARFRLACSHRLNAFIAQIAAHELAEHAAHALRQNTPALSAAKRHWRSRIALGLLIALLGVCLATFYGPTIAAIETALSLFFLSWLSLRLLGSFLPSASIECLSLSDHKLPVYTIIVALYSEARAVHGLIQSLQALEYPPEKLDIKLVLEPDDSETRAALSRLDLTPPFEIITAPACEPQTKPKALNAALPFARGTFTVIYDAEDRPEPDQLRRAVAMFVASAQDVACVQARLTIDNTGDGWLARMFTAEYAAQFDLFLPGLARMGVPIPLGGSSNHFRTSVLREVGAWDPYNVTEDADLGIRLARYGYRSVVIDSTTYEEAPAKLDPWIRQRTRWFKGWMQTWMVHMRQPVRLFGELGAKGFITFQLVVGGNAFSALIHPIFATMMAYALATGRPLFGVNGIPKEVTWAFIATLFAGYLVTVVVGIRGLARRRLLTAAPSLAGVVFHWLLLSWAAWRAVFQLIRAPYRWEKTAHGLAKTSRLAQSKRNTPPAPTPAAGANTYPQRRDAA